MIPADKSYTTKHLPDLECDLFADKLSSDALLEFFNTAINNGHVIHAIDVLGRLREKHQRDVQLAGLYIAACLMVNEDTKAMSTIEQLLTFSEHDAGMIQAGLAVRNRLGPIRIAPQKQETISLCMIVRNETENIAKCLFSVKPLIDEIILVDTGSEDQTQDIGRLFGAQVHHYAWDQDFSAARNYCLRKASGQWILILDADETIAPTDFKILRRMISSTKDKYQAYAFETRNYSHQTNAIGWQPNSGEYEKFEAGLGWFSSVKVRLFINQPGIRFHFPVHERVEPSLRASGIKTALCPVPVHHYGPLNESRNRKKALAYFQLGYTKLDLLGDDFSAIRELAVQAGQLERWTEAIELWQRLLALDPDYQEGLINMAGALWQMADYHQALSWAIRVAEVNGNLKEAWYNVAICRLFLGQIDVAVPILDRLSKANPSYIASQFMSAIAYGCKGDFNTASTLLKTLNGKLTGLALIWALQDSTKRFDVAGQVECARNLRSLKSHFLEQTQ